MKRVIEKDIHKNRAEQTGGVVDPKVMILGNSDVGGATGRREVIGREA